MRPFARQSSRLANASRIRQPSASQHRVDRQHRAFAGSAIRTEDVRPPSGPPGRHTPLNEPRIPQKSSESVGEHADSVGGEHAEANSGIEARKTGGRRTFRQRRLETVPKPPPIPEWFLKHNVKLVEERTKIDDTEVEIQTVHCIDTETGHTLFSVPYYQPPEPRGRKTVRKKNTHPVEAQKDAQAVPQEPSESDGKALDGSKPTRTDAEAKGELGQDFFGQKYNVPQTRTAKSKQKPQQDHHTNFEPPTKDDSGILSKEWRTDPMRWPFLEAETSIRAAFCFADDTQPLSRFATDQVDVSLQCPDPNSHEQMDMFVHDLANIVNADVIQLDANDFAELTEEYVGQGDDKPGAFSNLAYDVFDGYVATSVDKRSRRLSWP